MPAHKTFPPPKIAPFTGEGVYFVTDVHSVRSLNEHLSPAKLVQALAAILDYQTSIIQDQGGMIEQFAGGCVIAYWPPSSGLGLVDAACGAATRLMAEKVKVPDFEYCVRVKFVASELTGATFGAAASFRYQVVGKARERTNALPNLFTGKDSVVTNADTFGKMSSAIRSQFVESDSAVFSLVP
jgi:class 3 adenylate cyclase